MKAKKIVSFCSLFSLVLILSVYYVLSPIGTKSEVVSNIKDSSSEVVVNVSDGETAYFNNLEVLKENAYLASIKELEAIVASATSSKEEKLEALVAKNSKMKMNETEKKLASLIKEKGYDNVYVEYENTKVNILVSKKEATKKDALEIMRSVYPSLGDGYTPLVMFKA